MTKEAVEDFQKASATKTLSSTEHYHFKVLRIHGRQAWRIRSPHGILQRPLLGMNSVPVRLHFKYTRSVRHPLGFRETADRLNIWITTTLNQRSLTQEEGETLPSTARDRTESKSQEVKMDPEEKEDVRSTSAKRRPRPRCQFCRCNFGHEKAKSRKRPKPIAQLEPRYFQPTMRSGVTDVTR